MSDNVVKFKGNGTGLLMLLDQNTPYPQLEAAIKARLAENAKSFPAGTVIKTSPNGFGQKAQAAMMAIFDKYSLKLEFSDEALVRNAPAARSEHRAHRDMPASRDERVEEMLVINRTVRGGEEISSKSSVLICGNVNPGAQIIAGGSIDIRGTCRGVVHAGAFGDTEAFVIADNLMPVQIRIADLIARSPDNMEKRDKAERAFIKDGQIVIESIER